MPGALQAHEFSDVLEVLAENVLVASREHRHGADAELEQLLFSRRIVHYINRAEVNAFFERNSFVLRQLLQPGWVNRIRLSATLSMIESSTAHHRATPTSAA